MLRQSGAKDKQECGDVQSEQIDALVLNSAQLDALQNVRAQHAGLTSEHFRNREWFNSDVHVMALNVVLAQHPRLSVDDVLNRMREDTPLQLRAMLAGMNEKDVKRLNPAQLMVLIAFGNESMQRFMESPRNFNLARVLAERSWFDSDLHYKVLHQMVMKYGYPFEQSIDSLQELTRSQLQLLDKGMRLGITADQVRDQKWIDGDGQIDALLALWQSTNKHCAFEFCQKFTSDWQTDAMKQHANSDELADILALQNRCQLDAYNRLHDYGMCARDLHDAEWFNSAYHVSIFSQLVVNKCNKVHVDIRTELLNMRSEVRAKCRGIVTERVTELEAALNQAEKDFVKIEKMRKREAVLACINAIADTTPLQAKVMFQRKYETRSRVIALNDFQASAIIDITFPMLSSRDVEGLGWLTSKDRLEVFKYLLKDTRLLNLQQSHVIYHKVCVALLAWDDETFRRTLTNPANPEMESRTIYALDKTTSCRLPEVDELIAQYDAMLKASRAATGRDGCSMM